MFEAITLGNIRQDSELVNGTDDANGLLNFPPEILLHILSYLDLPDLAIVAQVAPSLVPLTDDPVLHTQRLRIVSPSRVNHNLFAKGPQGHLLRPTVGDLVQRGVIRGLAIERRWRMGAYFYSFNSIIQYDNSRTLHRRHASHVLSVQLQRRTSKESQVPTSSLRTLYSCHVLPDVESSSLNFARSLLPVVRKLKWSIQKDKLAKVFKDSGMRLGVGPWLDSGNGSGRKVLLENEKLRLALCPDIRKRLGFFERLGRT
ncbi:hypothetical protein GALMADRAFT_386298 [Galerina marginata CBS 339.88]|uniref:F-box domain-containing protein n=1 Tax=Galerina marginata (strain CBS 339.88) TaxID=685588 RepID=A0A067TRE8_GALM3|nr:hypothetical protein GALMADRAFT_386298 [Galerina marginata CBS 339.88]